MVELAEACNLACDGKWLRSPERPGVAQATRIDRPATPKPTEVGSELDLPVFGWCASIATKSENREWRHYDKKGFVLINAVTLMASIDHGLRQ